MVALVNLVETAEQIAGEAKYSEGFSVSGFNFRIREPLVSSRVPS